MIACYGDSLTYGFGLVEGRKWIDLVNKKGYDLKNYGINGETLLQIRQRVKRDAPQGRTFVMGGTNDFAMDLSVDLVFDVYQDLASYFSQRGVDALFGIPLPADPESYIQKSLALKLEDLHERMLKAFPREELVDFYAAFSPYDGKYFFDDVHPNKLGAEKMAEVFLKEVDL